MAWMQCPQYREYSRKYYQSEKAERLFLLGRLVAKGLETIYTYSGNVGEINDFLANVPEDLYELVAKGIELGSHVPGNILFVESPIGKCKPDIIHTLPDHDNAPCITDFKVKEKLADQYIESTVLEYLDSHQLKHYAWAYSSQLNEFVDRWIAAYLIILKPRPRYVHVKSLLTVQQIYHWYENAYKYWCEMEEFKQKQFSPKRNDINCYNKYGKCYFYDACHIMQNKIELVNNFYMVKK